MFIKQRNINAFLGLLQIMEKPQRKTSILNLEKKKSSDLCRTTSPVMSRKKSRRKSSVKTPAAEQVKEVKQEIGLNFAKRKESSENTVDQNPTRRRSRHRKSTSFKVSVTPFEHVVEHCEKNVFDGLVERRLECNNGFDSTTSCIDNKASSKDEQKTGASFEELLSTIDKEFGKKEFFTRSITKIESNETNTERPYSGEIHRKEKEETSLVNGLDAHKENNFDNDFSKTLLDSNTDIDAAISETKQTFEKNSLTNEAINNCKKQVATSDYSMSKSDEKIPVANGQSESNTCKMNTQSSHKADSKSIKDETGSTTQDPINDDSQKKVFRRHFGVGRRPSKPWQPPAKSTNLEFGISYVK